MTDSATLRQAATESVVLSEINSLRSLTEQHKDNSGLAVAEYLSTMPDADVPVVTTKVSIKL